MRARLKRLARRDRSEPGPSSAPRCSPAASRSTARHVDRGAWRSPECRQHPDAARPAPAPLRSGRDAAGLHPPRDAPGPTASRTTSAVGCAPPWRPATLRAPAPGLIGRPRDEACGPRSRRDRGRAAPAASVRASRRQRSTRARGVGAQRDLRPRSAVDRAAGDSRRRSSSGKSSLRDDRIAGRALTGPRPGLPIASAAPPRWIVSVAGSPRRPRRRRPRATPSTRECGEHFG